MNLSFNTKYEFRRKQGVKEDVRFLQCFADGSAMISGFGIEVFEGKPDSWTHAVRKLKDDGYELHGEADGSGLD